jgi:hypothetical protein
MLYAHSYAIPAHEEDSGFYSFDKSISSMATQRFTMNKTKNFGCNLHLWVSKEDTTRAELPSALIDIPSPARLKPCADIQDITRSASYTLTAPVPWEGAPGEQRLQ